MTCKFLKSDSQKWRILFLLNFLLVLLSCSLMLNMHYSADTNGIWFMQDNDYTAHFRNGRFISAIFFKALAALEINVAKVQSASVLVFMLCVAFAAVLLTKHASAGGGECSTISLIGTDAAFLLVFHNAFIAEWYIFAEVMPMYTVAVLSVAWSALSYVRISEENTKHAVFYIVVSLLALTISLGSYQVCIGIYIALLLILVFIHRELSVKKRFLLACGGLTLGAVGCILNVMIVKLITALGIMEPTSRGMTTDLQTIWENLRTLWNKQLELWNGYHLYPKYVLPIFFLTLLFLLLFLTIRRRSSWQEVLLALVFSVFIYAGTFIPHFVSSDFWVSQRTLVPFISLFSFAVIAIITLDSPHQIRKFTVCVAGVFLLCNSLIMQDVFSNHLVMDAEDTAYAQAIQTYIMEYTAETGEEINSVCFEYDSSVTWSYKDIDYVAYDLNVKNILTRWSNVQLMNRVNNTSYEQTSMDENVWADYFEGKNWDSFDPTEQIVFKNHTAYIVLY